jgi:hypothetical protein
MSSTLPVTRFGHAVVAALVRLADELDEDFRRGDPKVAKKLGISEDSKFYWQFNQRIQAVRPDRATREIWIGVRFEPKDVDATVRLSSTQRLFFAAFAEKIAKINHERMVVNEFLPQSLQYRRLLISVKPIVGDASFKKPREFVFNDATTASEFITAFPELSRDPVNEALKTVLDQIRLKKLDEAAKGLQRLEEILSDLPTDVRLRVLWNWANVWSLRAESLPRSPRKRKEALDRGAEYLKRWYEYGIGGAWSELGMTPENEVFKITTDHEMSFLYRSRKARFRKWLGGDGELLTHTDSSGAGGCIPAGVSIEAPGGDVLIEMLQLGTTIFSADTKNGGRRIKTKVARVYRSKEPECVCVDDRFLFTPSQPLYLRDGPPVLAGALLSSSEIMTADGQHYTVSKVSRVKK